jgi:hypothetical protein
VNVVQFYKINIHFFVYIILIVIDIKHINVIVYIYILAVYHSIFIVMPPLGKLYTLDDFGALIFSENKYVLPDSVFATFRTIEQNIEIPAFTEPSTPKIHPPRERNDHRDRSVEDTRFGGKHPTHNVKGKGYNNNAGRGKRDAGPSAAEDWGMMRSFKTTKIEMKTGIDKITNDLRTQINKISTANYNKQRDSVFSLIRTYLESTEASSENTVKLSSAIFQIMCSNKMLSSLYSTLYAELIAEFPVFSTLLEEFVMSFHETIHTIEYVNPDENYDEFCRITKNNDRRKNTTQFIVNVINRGTLNVSFLLNILRLFMDTIMTNICEVNKTAHVEELVENLYIIVLGGIFKLRDLPEWQGINDTIMKLANSQTCEYTSMSNRIMFKLMDIIDAIKQ